MVGREVCTPDGYRSVRVRSARLYAKSTESAWSAWPPLPQYFSLGLSFRKEGRCLKKMWSWGRSPSVEGYWVR